MNLFKDLFLEHANGAQDQSKPRGFNSAEEAQRQYAAQTSSDAATRAANKQAMDEYRKAAADDYWWAQYLQGAPARDAYNQYAAQTSSDAATRAANKQAMDEYRKAAADDYWWAQYLQGAPARNAYSQATVTTTADAFKKDANKQAMDEYKKAAYDDWKWVQYQEGAPARDAYNQYAAQTSRDAANASKNRGFNSAEEAQRQYSAQTSRDASKKRSFGSAEEAQRQYAATTSADAAKRSIHDKNQAEKQGAEEAQRRAAAQSTRDALSSGSAKMNWNDTSDSQFQAWKQAYNRQYYQAHKKEWQKGGKYYIDAVVGRSRAQKNSDNLYYTDSKTGQTRLANNVYRDPVTGGYIDLRNASSEAQNAMKKLQAAAPPAQRMLNEYGDRSVGEKPSFLGEVATSARNLGKNVSNLADLGRNFITSLIRK